jgi:hypothetical protein
VSEVPQSAEDRPSSPSSDPASAPNTTAEDGDSPSDGQTAQGIPTYGSPLAEASARQPRAVAGQPEEGDAEPDVSSADQRDDPARTDKKTEGTTQSEDQTQPVRLDPGALKREQTANTRAMFGLLGVEADTARIRDQFNAGRDQTNVGGDQYSAGRDQNTFHNNGSGPVTVGGEHKHFHGANGDRLGSSGPVDREVLDQRKACNVATSSQLALRRLLTEGGLAMLCGRRNTGRRHTALVSLAECVKGDGQVTLLPELSAAGQLEELEFTAANAYLLDATGLSWLRQTTEATVSALAAKVQAGSCALVILCDAKDLAPSWSRYVVDHEPPKAVDVLRRHLLGRLGVEEPEALIEAACGQKAIKESIARMLDPWDAVAHADALAGWDRSGRPAYVDLQPYRKTFVLRQARDLLLADSGSPRSQAYVIAGAVLDGEAENDVVIAAHQLTNFLLKEQGEQNITVEVFRDSLGHWLPHVHSSSSRQDSPGTLSARSTDAEMSSGRPVVQLYEATLAGVLLEVLWGEYDRARDPLKRWLNDLSRWPDFMVRVRVAQAVAKLATHDFESIEESTLRVWAASDEFGQEQVVAWALEGVVVDGREADKVLDLLDRWTRVRGTLWHRAALRAYGGRIGAQWPTRAFRALRGARALPEFWPHVGRSFVDIYLAGARGEVLSELMFWSRGTPAVKKLAAFIFARIIDVPRPADGHGPGLPDLLVWPEDDDAGRERIATLWRVILHTDLTRGQAWNLLRLWEMRVQDRLKECPESKPEHDEAMGASKLLSELLTAIESDPHLCRRLRHQRLIWRSWTQRGQTRAQL